MTSSRRKRIWTTSSGTLNLTAAGIGGGKSSNLASNWISSTGLASMFGCTVGRTHLCALVQSAMGETAVVANTLFLGIGVYPTLMDDIDFPALANSDGSWMAQECTVFRMPGAGDLPVLPGEAAFLRADYRSMRKVDEVGYNPFLVAQQEVAEAVDVRFVVTQLILLP